MKIKIELARAMRKSDVNHGICASITRLKPASDVSDQLAGLRDGYRSWRYYSVINFNRQCRERAVDRRCVNSVTLVDDSVSRGNIRNYSPAVVIVLRFHGRDTIH